MNRQLSISEGRGTSLSFLCGNVAVTALGLHIFGLQVCTCPPPNDTLSGEVSPPNDALDGEVPEMELLRSCLWASSLPHLPGLKGQKLQELWVTNAQNPQVVGLGYEAASPPGFWFCPTPGPQPGRD